MWDSPARYVTSGSPALFIIPPINEVQGGYIGITPSVRLSVCLSVCAVSFQRDNFCKFYQISFKLSRLILYRITLDGITFGGGPSMTLTSGDLEKLKIHFFSNISQSKRDRVYICIVYIQEIIYGLSIGDMTFDLGSRSRGQIAILTNIFETMRDRDFICIIYIQEIIYGLSFGAMTFDLGSRSKVKMLFSLIYWKL